MSSQAANDRPRAGVATGLKSLPGRMRASAHATWADRRRRWRLIRTTAVWTLIAIAVATFFALFSWDWFRGPIARYASAQTGRDIRIEGHLQVHPFSWTPSATVGGLKVAHPRWMGKTGDTLDFGRTTVKVKLVPLFAGRVELPLVDIEHPTLDLFSDKTGRNNWTLGRGGGHAKAPPIEQFILHDGKIHLYDAKRRLLFDGTVTTTEGAAQAGGTFRMEGRGALNRAPFLALVSGAPLLHVKRDQPYPFKADIHAGSTHVIANGRVVRPFDLGHVRAGMDVTGADLANLYDLTGVVLPNTPAYHLTADLTRDDERFDFRRLSGRVGASDLHGNLLVERRSGRRFLKGELRSNVLDWGDMGALFGSSRAGHAAAPSRTLVRGGAHRLLPDAPLYADRVRAMDADVRYHAASVRAPNLPLRQVDLHLTLDHGVLQMNPVAFTFPRGQARGHVRLDARPATPVTDFDMVVSHLRVEDFLPKVQGLTSMAAPLEARAKLHGLGNTVHKAAASSDGVVAVAMTQGQIRKAVAELMGVNVVPGLIEYLKKDPKQTDLRCAVATFDVKGGVLQARQLVLDTGVVTLSGSGTVNLGTETVDLTLKGKSKKPRLVRVIAPFHVQGPLSAPRFKVDAGPAIVQAGAGLTLGAVLSPLAAILPFLSPGGAKDVDCSGLLAQAAAVGAPVAR